LAFRLACDWAVGTHVDGTIVEYMGVLQENRRDFDLEDHLLPQRTRKPLTRQQIASAAAECLHLPFGTTQSQAEGERELCMDAGAFRADVQRT